MKDNKLTIKELYTILRALSEYEVNSNFSQEEVEQSNITQGKLMDMIGELTGEIGQTRVETGQNANTTNVPNIMDNKDMD